VSSKRFSIAVVMKLTAIIALNFAVLRLVPEMRAGFPTSVFAIVMINLLLVQAVALGLPLRVFHFTFLIVGFISCGVTIALVFTISRPVPGSLRILEAAIQHYRSVGGQSRVISPLIEFPMLRTAEAWLACILGLLPAWAAAVLASWSMRRRFRLTSEWCRIVAAFLKGALIGFGFFCLGVTLANSFFGPWHLDPQTARAAWYVQWVCLVTCPLLGGMAVATLPQLRLRKHEWGKAEPSTAVTKPVAS
jgi:hypothetical protein